MSKSGMPVKPISKSDTSTAVGYASAAATLTLGGFLAWVRSEYGDVLPWPYQVDVLISVAFHKFIVPRLSRVIKKKLVERREGDRMGSNLTLPVLALLVAGLSMAGCQSLGLLPTRSVTVTYPDGRIEATTTADTEATEAMLRVQLAALEQAVATWRDIAEWQTGQDRIDAEAKAADRAARAEQLRVLLDGLAGLTEQAQKDQKAQKE